MTNDSTTPETREIEGREKAMLVSEDLRLPKSAAKMPRRISLQAV